MGISRVGWCMTVLLNILKLFSIVCGNCQWKNPGDPHVVELLNRLKPLYGQSFKAEGYDETVNHTYKYYMTICGGVKIDGRLYDDDVGIIQEDPAKEGDSRYVEIGRLKDTLIKGGTNWIMLTYTNGKKYGSHCNKIGQGRRQGHIMIVCDQISAESKFKVLYEHNSEDDESSCFYLMELSTSVVCSPSPHSTGLSSGSIFLIVFFTCAAAYLLIGALYNRCVYGSKGLSQIPHLGFWKTCGSLQADGCAYMCKCTGAGYYSNKPYEGVADDQLDEEIDDEHLLPM